MSQSSSQRTTRHQQKINYYALGQDGIRTKEQIADEKIHSILKITSNNNNQDQTKQIEKDKSRSSQLQSSFHKNYLNSHRNSLNRVNLESNQQTQCFYSLNFNRVYHDQPSLLNFCCWICLEITPKCMYQCSKCGMYLCSSCQVLSSVSNKCYHCSSFNTNQIIKGDTRQKIQDSEFLCQYNKYGCTVRQDSSQLQNHEKLCEFSIKDKREQLRGLERKDDKKNKENIRVAQSKKDNLKKSRNSQIQSQEDDEEEQTKSQKKQSQEVQPKMDRKKPISKGRTYLKNNKDKSFGQNKLNKVKITAF